MWDEGRESNSDTVPYVSLSLDRTTAACQKIMLIPEDWDGHTHTLMIQIISPHPAPSHYRQAVVLNSTLQPEVEVEVSRGGVNNEFLVIIQNRSPV